MLRNRRLRHHLCETLNDLACGYLVRFLRTLDGPRKRISFQVREALHCFLHAFFISKPRILDTAKWRHFDAKSGNFPNVHRADVELVHKTCDVVEPVSADT